MKKSINIFTALGLMLLLAACGATETTTGQSTFITATSTVSPPDTPTPEPEPPTTEEIMATEEPTVTEEPVVEEPTATMEVMPTEEMAATQEVAATEEVGEPTEEATEEVMETATEEMMVEEKEEMAEQIDMPQPTTAQQQLLDSLAVIGTPPELNNEVWLNSDPLQLADLRGQVVIVEFWTFG